MFLVAHPLQIFLDVSYQLWPAQASSELGLIYRLWLAQNWPSPAACSLRAGLLASLDEVQGTTGPKKMTILVPKISLQNLV